MSSRLCELGDGLQLAADASECSLGINRPKALPSGGFSMSQFSILSLHSSARSRVVCFVILLQFVEDIASEVESSIRIF